MMKQSRYHPDYPGRNPGFCLEDCSLCVNDETGEWPFFRQVFLEDGQLLKFENTDASRILFLMRGSLLLENSHRPNSVLNAGQCYFFTREEIKCITARGAVFLVRVDFVRRLEISGKDCLKELEHWQEPASMSITPPVLTINTMIKDTLLNLFAIPGLESKPCFHHLKMTEICMMMTYCYTTKELVCFFRSIIRPADDFRAFVLTHYNRMKTVAQFAEMSGMSKSVFQKKFAETFGDTVSHWMMKQKALGVSAAVRAGMTSVKDLMYHFGFSNEAVFGHFCKTYMGGSPATVIASAHRYSQRIREKEREKSNQ